MPSLGNLARSCASLFSCGLGALPPRWQKTALTHTGFSLARGVPAPFLLSTPTPWLMPLSSMGLPSRQSPAYQRQLWATGSWTNVWLAGVKGTPLFFLGSHKDLHLPSSIKGWMKVRGHCSESPLYCQEAPCSQCIVGWRELTPCIPGTGLRDNP